MLPGSAETLDDLLARADREMYSVKRRKKDAARPIAVSQGARL
jgi:predicted signal transduction protein with EAL and GGDEF domain